MIQTSATRILGSALLALCLASCAKPIGKNYAQPETVIPASYKNTTHLTEAGTFPEGNWWTQFRDPELTRLVESVEPSNFTIGAALARIDRAWAILGVTKADRLPNASGVAGVFLDRSSDSAEFQGGQSGEFYDGRLVMNWEIDLWGRIKRLVEGSRADAVATEQDYANLLLSLRAQTARIYFTLRALDEEIRVVDATAGTRQTALDLQTKLADAGNASDLEVARAESELATTLAVKQNLLRSRGQLENALAVLVGANPSEFTLAARSWNGSPPRVPSGIPGELLVRRPDVAAAESLLVAANARIGAAKGDFLPRVLLTGDGGVSAIQADDFLNWSSRSWTVGPSVELPVFQGGRLKSNLKRAEAEYNEALSDYQQQILIAFQDVEDALNDLKTIRAESAALDRAVSSSRRVEELSNKRYTDGLVNYFEVVDAQRITLEAERRQVQLRGESFNATVSLIQALGGGWNVEVPKPKKQKEPEEVVAVSATTEKGQE